MRLAAAALVMAAGISACSKASNVTALSPPPGVPIEDNFGPGFGQAFRAAPNSVPVNPSASGVVPVNPAGQPFQVP